MEIETERLKLIPCDSHSLKILAAQKYENGPQITNHLKELEEDPTSYGWGCWLVLRKVDELIIGDAGFKGKPNSRQEVEVGYGFLERYWGQGFATEAVQGLMDWAFDGKAAKKVTAETNVDNYGSIRVLERIGMKKTKRTKDMIYWELTKQRH